MFPVYFNEMALGLEVITGPSIFFEFDLIKQLFFEIQFELFPTHHVLQTHKRWAPLYLVDHHFFEVEALVQFYLRVAVVEVVDL
jgi:hypothetical protein